jgi:cytoskeletal protein CcmA (bactofilin family)
MVRGPVHDRPAARDARAGAGDAASTLGRGARVRGRIHGDGDLRVEGHVEGDVSVSGALVVEEGGAIDGDVGAASVEIGGALTGDVASQGPVAIRATARVEGNLGAAEVTMDEGATFRGRIEAEFDLPAALSEGLSEGTAAGRAGGRGR